MADCSSRLNIGQLVMTYFNDRPALTTGYVFAMAAFPLGSVVLPAILGIAIENVKNKLPVREWTPLIVAMIVLLVLRLICNVLWFYLDSVMNSTLLALLRDKVFKDVLGAYSFDYRTLRVSSVVAKMIKLPSSVMDAVRVWHQLIIPGVVTLIAILGVVAWIDLRLAGVLGVLTAVLCLCMWASMYTCADGIEAADYDHDEVIDDIGDSLDNLLHIYLSDAAQEEVQRLEIRQKASVEAMVQAQYCANHFMTLMKLLFGVVAVGVMIYVWRRFNNPNDTIVDTKKFAALVFVLVASTHVLYNALDAWPHVVYHMARVRKLETYVNRLQTQEHRPRVALTEDSEQVYPVSTATLEFMNVRFRYHEHGDDVLSGVWFGFGPSDRVLIRGSIGAGKSTIARLALGLHAYDGSIQIQSREVRMLDRNELSSLISYVPQGPTLLDRTVYENLRLGTNKTRQDIQDVLDEYDITFVDLDTQVGKGGMSLSTGQRTMLYVLRTAIKNTPIIICDEATANMDPVTKAKVVDLLNRISRNRLLLFISHDENIGNMSFTHTMTVANRQATVQASR